MKEYLIVDTGAFIRLTQLEKFGYRNIYVTPGVAAEIRDQKARHHLNFAIDVPQIIMPTEADIRYVKEFALETGDLNFLSSTDIQIIALTYSLSKQYIETLRDIPEFKMTRTKIQIDNKLWDKPVECQIDQDQDDDDGSDWIGDHNIEHLSGNQTGIDEKSDLIVACLTTDYSIQNVLLHMGLGVLSIDGMRIKEAKKWAVICRACKRTSTDTTRLFCAHCGNYSLRKVPMSIKPDGTGEIHVIPESYKNLRGKIYPIPKPKGGRKGDLILSEDQLFIGGRDRMLRRQQKLLEKEKAERDPFNQDNTYDLRGWWATASNRIVKPKIGLGPGNPNSNRWRKKHSKN